MPYILTYLVFSIPYSFPTKHSYRSVVDERVRDLFHHIMSGRPSFHFKSLEAIFCVLSLSLELNTFFMHPSLMFSYQLCDDMKNNSCNSIRPFDEQKEHVNII